jgi:hypothetical protein
MDADPSKPLPAFGFLTVLESPEHGLFGGYLVLSPQGRPLEFRCSTPIAPSRAQQILYGPTLRPYLLSEVIGQTLVAGAEVPVRLILTDLRDMLPLGLLRSELILHVEANVEAVCEHSAATEGSAADATDPATSHFDFAGCRVTPAELTSATNDELQALLAPLAAHVSLCEPFGRIVAALNEAQMASHDAAELADDRAAAA